MNIIQDSQIMLSIIITTRNRREELFNCVKSIINSRWFNLPWELIIIDDSSNDGTELLTITDLGLTNGQIYHSDKQLMMVKARNKGTRLAQGRYLLFVDDDNIVDPEMISLLIQAADTKKSYGIIGPSMLYKNKKKYLDYQTINFFMGRTNVHIDDGPEEICLSDGIPNVFLIKRSVFDKVGYFDERLVQTFSEPDFAFSAREHGFKCGIVKKARTIHNVMPEDTFSLRSLGGIYSQKAYCLMRNRSIIISRYAQWYHKVIYYSFFSWVWPILYSASILKHKRFDLIKLYWIGFFDGIYYGLTGRIRNSLPSNLIS